MAARPSWQGHLRLSLVTCPVALYPATSEADTVRFNLINPGTNNRIKMKTVEAGTGMRCQRMARRLLMPPSLVVGLLREKIRQRDARIAVLPGGKTRMRVAA